MPKKIKTYYEYDLNGKVVITTIRTDEKREEVTGITYDTKG